MLICLPRLSPLNQLDNTANAFQRLQAILAEFHLHAFTTASAACLLENVTRNIYNRAITFRGFEATLFD